MCYSIRVKQRENSMRETTHHYPQVISESEEFLNLFPNLTFIEMRDFFMNNYNHSDLNEKKFINSLRMSFFKFNDYSDNLSYS